jgi:4-amino-4-deoxy-L-arabinose transferase-like glycosyltransferase
MDGRSNYAMLIASILILGVGLWLVCEIPKGMLTTGDELFTAERSREMLLLGRSQVHQNFQSSYAKPPLQYWLTTLTLSQTELLQMRGFFQSPEVAVRVWPLIFGILTGGALVWLAKLIEKSMARPEPRRTGLVAACENIVPLSVAALISCPLFSTEISRALLDAGLMFFTTLAIVFAELARKRPACWFGVAIACWLGSLQKIPFIFLVWVVIILVRLASPTDRSALRSWWLVGSFILAIALAALWPCLQLVKYHARLDEVIGFGEFSGRIHNLSKRPYFEIPYRMSISWIGFGTLALFAPIILLFRKERPSAVREISILCLTVTILAIVSNARSVRYLLPIIPCFCILVGELLRWLLDQKRHLRTRVAIVVLLFFSIDIVEAKLMIDFRRQDAVDQQRVARELGLLQKPGANITLIRPSKYADVLSPSFYLFHGNLHFPIVASTVDQLILNRAPPSIGVSTMQDFAIIHDRYPEIGIRLQSAQFTCWATQY